ncbi:MAG: NAD(P)-dependent oxidoreductase [Bacteroidales bacterium]|nr:NAD(P)-dependent oxidoreductase [Bacteroidales bacterium]
MKSVLITGASGFVGSFLVEEAIKRNIKVFAAIRKSSSTEYLKNEKINIVYIDLSSKNAIKEILNDIIKNKENIDFIIHNAGITKAKRKNDFFEVNYNGTKNLVDAIVETGLKIEKFIYVSSLAVMGPCKDNRIEPMNITDEPNYKRTAYGHSKYMAEQYIQSFKELPWIILRPTGIYGPREKDYYELYKTLNNYIAPFVGKSEKYLTFIYVKDFAKLTFDVLNSNIIHKTYFVSDGNVYKYSDFVRLLKNILQKKAINIYIPLSIFKLIVIINEFIHKPTGKLPVLNRDKYEILKANNWICNIDELKTDFNFKATYDLEKGLKECIAWYKENKLL